MPQAAEQNSVSPENSSSPQPSAARLDACDPVFREHPHEVLSALREREPVHQDHAFDRVVLTRAADVAAVLGDRDLSSDPFKARPTTYGRRREDDRGAVSMLTLDDPDHARLRGLVAKAFTARAVETLRPRIKAIVAKLLDAIDPRRPFDLITSYAAPLPTLVVATMLGIDDADVAKFVQWSESIQIVFHPDRSEEEHQRFKHGLTALHDFLAEEVERRRVRPGDDLISALVAAEADGDKLSKQEIVANCRLLLVAGNVTTTDLIGNGVVAFLHHPDQLAAVRKKPELWPAAVEEVLRFDPPVAHLNRQALEARRIDGCPVEVGQTITTMLLAANRDPALHEDPHRFDIERKNQKHHSFGGGAHFCLGASLARLEAQIGFAALFDRFPELRLVGELRRKAVPTFHGYEAVRLSAA